MEAFLKTVVRKESWWSDNTGTVSEMQQKQTGEKGQEKIFSSYWVFLWVCFLSFVVVVKEKKEVERKKRLRKSSK